MKRLTLQDFKGKTKTDSAKSTKVISSLEFIKGGAEEYCHNGHGKGGGGMNSMCGPQVEQ
jgi:hypothetical protein